MIGHLSQVLVGFEHGIIDEEFSLIGGIVQMIKEFCNGVEMERVILWIEVEDIENIGVFSCENGFSFVVLFQFSQNTENIDVIVKIGIEFFDVFGEGMKIGLVRIEFKRGISRQKGIEDLFDQRWFCDFTFNDEEGVDVISH